MPEVDPSVILFLFVCAGVIATVYFIRSQRIKYVVESSPMLKEIEQLNTRFHFVHIAPNYNYNKECNSKAAFDKTKLSDVYSYYLLSDLPFFHSIAQSISNNNELYASYIKEYSRILSSGISNDFRQKKSFYQKTEEAECNKIKLFPVLNVQFKISCSYTSPQGRNRYYEQYIFNTNEFFSFLRMVDEQERTKTTKNYQRTIMTDSLRYDIMKRDGFRCVICGATAKDGAKLHVDHIFPVSRGGKTEPSNLRTLCDSCNLGKKAKYDYNGKN